MIAGYCQIIRVTFASHQKTTIIGLNNRMGNVITNATKLSTHACCVRLLSSTVPNAMAIISKDSTKSVRMAPLIFA